MTRVIEKRLDGASEVVGLFGGQTTSRLDVPVSFHLSATHHALGPGPGPDHLAYGAPAPRQRRVRRRRAGWRRASASGVRRRRHSEERPGDRWCSPSGPASSPSGQRRRNGNDGSIVDLESSDGDTDEIQTCTRDRSTALLATTSTTTSCGLPQRGARPVAGTPAAGDDVTVPCRLAQEVEDRARLFCRKARRDSGSTPIVRRVGSSGAAVNVGPVPRDKGRAHSVRSGEPPAMRRTRRGRHPAGPRRPP